MEIQVLESDCQMKMSHIEQKDKNGVKVLKVFLDLVLFQCVCVRVCVCVCVCVCVRA